jgi:hypothetical protein
MVKLVESMLQLHKKLQKARIPDEKTMMLQRQIDALVNKKMRSNL